MLIDVFAQKRFFPIKNQYIVFQFVLNKSSIHINVFNNELNSYNLPIKIKGNGYVKQYFNSFQLLEFKKSIIDCKTMHDNNNK